MFAGPQTHSMPVALFSVLLTQLPLLNSSSWASRRPTASHSYTMLPLWPCTFFALGPLFWPSLIFSSFTCPPTLLMAQFSLLAIFNLLFPLPALDSYSRLWLHLLHIYKKNLFNHTLKQPCPRFVQAGLLIRQSVAQRGMVIPIFRMGLPTSINRI